MLFATLSNAAAEHAPNTWLGSIATIAGLAAMCIGLGSVFSFPLMDVATEVGGKPGAGAGAPPTTQHTPATVVGQNGANSGIPAEQLNAVLDPLMQRVTAHIDTRLAPITQQQTALDARLTQLAQPTQQAASVFSGGHAPAGIVGELPGKAEARGFQMYRLLGLLQKSPYTTKEHCKYELGLSERLHKVYVQQHGFSLGGNEGSLLMPLGSDMLIDIEGEAELQAEVRFTMQQGIRGCSPGELQWAMQRAGMDKHAMRQTLSQFDDTALGIFTHGGPMGELIELIRAREVMSRAGVTEITLPPNGRLPFPKQTSAGTAYWVGESQAITESEPATGAFELIAKKLAALVKCPNELIRFGTPSVEAFFRADMARVLALKADRTLLDGVGSTTSPKGLINFEGVNLYVASTVATDGNTFQPEDVGLMTSVVEELDHDLDTSEFKFVMRPKMWNNIQNRRSGSGYAANDGKGPWLFQVNRSDIAAGRQSMLSGNPVLRSTQISNTRSKGSSTDLSYILGGIFAHYLLGRVGVLELTTTTQGDTSFVNDQTWLKAIQHLDGSPRYPNAFVWCDTIDMDLPAV